MQAEIRAYFSAATGRARLRILVVAAGNTATAMPTAAHGAGTSLPKIGPSLAAHGETETLLSLISLLPLAVSQYGGGGGGAVFGMEGAEDVQPCFGRAGDGGFLREWLLLRTLAQPISQPISEGGTDGCGATASACEKVWDASGPPHSLHAEQSTALDSRKAARLRTPFRTSCSSCGTVVAGSSVRSRVVVPSAHV